MALMIQASFGLLGWAIGVWYVPAGLSVLVAGIWIVSRTRGVFSGRWFTPLITAGLAGVTFAVWLSNAKMPHPALEFFSPAVFLLMLLVILAADVVELAPALAARSAKLGQRLPWQRVAVWGFVVVFVIYMILVPTGGWIMDLVSPPKSGELPEGMSLAEQVRLRTMEAMSALWFFSLGATIGSFLNVVAYRLPRRESIVFKRSRCPQCGTQIKGRDNVPIFGWLMLGGRCRACQTPISPRYPIVELITGGLFLTFYFVELISGGANIPVRQPNTFRGVVWIIMYTKWDLVGFYLYHCLTLSVLLSCVLIDIDHQQVRARTRWFVAVMLLVPLWIWPSLIPVPFLADGSQWLSASRFQTGLQYVIGGGLGAALGALSKWAICSERTRVKPPGQVASFLAVVGMALGWQAVIVVTLFGLLLRMFAGAIAGERGLSLPFTVMLFVAFVSHHIVWRWSIEYGSPWWPSHLTSVGGWIGVAVAVITLVLVNRQLTSRTEGLGLEASQIDSIDPDGANVHSVSRFPYVEDR